MGRISMPQGKGSQLHNRREYDKIGQPIPDNIDSSRTCENLVLVDKDIREAYQDIFGEALAEYNAKQKRADRRIDDYYSHIAKSKNGEKLFYEDVLQWGKKEDFESPQTRERAKRVLISYVNSFEQRNPNLKLIGAYIHMDEASPHLHLDYIPVAHGYSRGLAVRNSLDRAMKEMGYTLDKESRKNNATKLWKESERAYFGEICRGMGLEVEAERKARGSLSVEEYKEARDSMLGEVEHELAEKKAQVASMDEIASYIASDAQKGIKAENYTIEAKKSLLGQIKEPERVGVFVENMNAAQVGALMQRVSADEGIEHTLERTQKQCKSLVANAQAEADDIRASATADRNEAVAEANRIIALKDSIIRGAKEFETKIKDKCQELVDKISELTNKKDKLEQEVSQLEPLHQEFESMVRAKNILSGEVDYELTKAQFKSWDSMPFGTSYSAYIDQGKLIALYKDGTTRKVGYNLHGGMDSKILDDRKQGLCDIGIMLDEERVRVPKSILKELLNARDIEKPISQSLKNFIVQQNDVEQVAKSRSKSRGMSR